MEEINAGNTRIYVLILTNKPKNQNFELSICVIFNSAFCILHLLSFRSHLHSYERPVADDYRRVVVRGVLEFEILAEFAVR